MATAPKQARTAKSKSSTKTDSLTEQDQRPPQKRSVKRRIANRYDRHMPNRKRHRVLIWVVFLVSSSIIALQLLYPPERALPLTRVAGESVAWREHEQLAEVIDEYFRNTKLKLITEGEASVEVALASAGAEPNTEPMIAQVVEYPFWQRFIPLSILLHMTNITEADVYYTNSILEMSSKEQAEQLSVEPVNARLAIQDGELVATAEEQGRIVAAAAVQSVIAHASPTLGKTTILKVPATHIDPAETASSLQSVREAAEAALTRQVVIVAEGRTFIPSDVTVASWLQISTDKEGKPMLAVTSEGMNTYFDAIDAEVGAPAGQTNINLINGHETSRTTGATGRAINRSELISQIGDWLLAGVGQGEFIAAFQEVAPSIIYDNKYTATEEGLRSYVTDASERLNVRIAIQQLDGGKWTASARADESIPSASTYKLFVAKWLFDQMDKGTVHWDDPMLDTTVSVCFDRMTIASTNPCAESWLAQAGRENVNQYLYNLGFSQGTSFTHPTATHSTANDLQRIMLGINDSSIIGGAHRDRLLHSLSVHPYRYGIPTGSAGQVWDKVGFLWDYVHDTAIVKHPKGTYVMTIMTKGQSYATIANLTREIERIMYP